MAEPETGPGIGRQVERLSRQMVKTDAQVRSLAAGLQRLTERVTATSPDGGTTEQPEQVEVLPSWLTTSDFPEGAAMVEALMPWLAAVYLRFPDSDLPTCWALHPHVVEELWWLRNAWYDAFAGPKPSWQKVGDWHDRQRPNVVKRLSDAGSGTRCNLGKHTNPQPEPAAPMPELLPHVLRAWCSTGRAQWPLSPTAEQLAQARRHEDAAAERR
jgi:hypothetical protein